MRVLQVNKFLYRRGGAEAYMEDASELLRAAGHTVAYWGMHHPLNVHTEYAQHFVSNVELDPPPPGAVPRARAAARMIWSREASERVVDMLDEFKPDVVHAHNVYHQLSPSVLRAISSRGVPIVMTLHDYKLACPSHLFLSGGEVCEDCLGGNFLNAVRRRCKGGSRVSSAVVAFETAVHRGMGVYGNVRLFACPSHFMRKKMEEAEVYPERLRVLHNFIQVPAGEAAAADGSVFYAGRLSREKGVDVLVEAAGRAEDLQVTIAGDGPERTALESRAASIAPGRVRFLGHVSAAEVQATMSTASVVCAPSRCYENQPLMVLEALGLGVPVVGSALGGIAELIRDGEFGRTVPADDPEALAAALRQVTSDPVSGRAMGAAGRRHVEQQYSAAAHLRGLQDLYEEALA
jgi:glycosyltransferase involved in cell wall biosynthesis